MQHAVADYLSRLESGEPAIGVRDDFPDAQLIQIEANCPEVVQEDTVDAWLTEITIFLNIGLPPEGMTLDEQKRMVVRGQNFCLLKGSLYHKGVDGIWRRIIRQFEKPVLLREAQCGVEADIMLGRLQLEKYGVASYGG